MKGYMEQMKEDIREYIKDNGYTTEEELNDILWTADSVTGNGSGSYFFSRAKACEMVTENGMDYLSDAVEEGFLTCEDVGKYVLDDNWEALDVTIRCYLLGQAIAEALDEND